MLEKNCVHTRAWMYIYTWKGIKFSGQVSINMKFPQRDSQNSHRIWDCCLVWHRLSQTGCLNLLTPSRCRPGGPLWSVWWPKTPHRFSSHLLQCHTLNGVVRGGKGRPGSSYVTSGVHAYNFYPCVNSHVQIARTLLLRQFCAINIQFHPANVYCVTCVYVHRLGLCVICSSSSVRRDKTRTVYLLVAQQFYFMSFVR